MDLTVNNCNNRTISPNFRAKIIRDSSLDKDSFFFCVEDEFTKITENDPAKYYLLRPLYRRIDSTREINVLSFSNLCGADMTLVFNDKFSSDVLKMDGYNPKDVAQMFSNARFLLNRASDVLRNFQKSVSNQENVTNEVCQNLRDGAIKDLKKILTDYATGDKLIKKYGLEIIQML